MTLSTGLQTRRLVVLIVTLFFAFTALASSPLPKGKVDVGYRQRSNGTMSKEVYQMWLECGGTSCALTVLTLNMCVGGAFYPQVERFTTGAGELRVAGVSRTSIVIEQKLGDLWGDGVWTHRFHFKAAGTVTAPSMGELTGYSGQAMKHSQLLGKTIRWDSVPLDVFNYQITFDCPAALGFPSLP